MGIFDAVNPLTKFQQLGNLLGGDNGQKTLNNVKGIYGKLGAQQSALYANALGQHQQGLKAINTGYTNALNAVNTASAGAKQGILDQQTTNTGNLTSNLVDNGRLGSTVGANQQRAIYSDTNRALTNVDATLAQIRSGLEAAKGQALAGQYGDIAGLFQNENSANVGLGASYINTLSGVQDHSKDWITSLLSAAGNAVGHAA